MDSGTAEKIIELLDACSNQGLNFEQAKEQLLNQGFSAEQIDLATDNYSYGVKRVSDIPVEVEDYFKNHPKQAAEDGRNLAKAVHDEVVKDERTQAELDIIGGESAPRVDIQSQVYFGHKFANDVGISYWLFVILGIIVNIVALLLATWLKLSHWLYLVNSVLFIGLIVMLIRRIK